MGKANKDELSRPDNKKVGKANIKVNKNTNKNVIENIDNNANDGNKIND